MEMGACLIASNLLENYNIFDLFLIQMQIKKLFSFYNDSVSFEHYRREYCEDLLHN